VDRDVLQYVPEGKDIGKPVKLRDVARAPISRQDLRQPAGTRTAIISFAKEERQDFGSAAFLLLLHLCGPRGGA
jgi:hypothetical protein